MRGARAKGKLSEREREILLLAADGRTDKAIATELGLSPATVGTHWERLRAKLNAANRSEAIAKALAESYRKTLGELEDANRWVRLLIDTAEDYAIFMTDEKGTLLTWNLGVARVLGFLEEEFVGQNIDMLFLPADLQTKAPEYERETARQHGRSLDARWHRRKDDLQVWIDGVLILLSTDDGETRFAKIMRDGSRERQLLEEVERLRAEVRRLVEAAR